MIAGRDCLSGGSNESLPFRSPNSCANGDLGQRVAPACRKRLAKRSSTMNSYRSWFHHKSHREERKYFVPGRDGWLASLIDQVLGHDTVWIRHVSRKEWRNIAVRRAVGQLPTNEPITECSRIGGKSLCPADSVTLEAVGQDGEVLPLEPVPDCLDLVAGDFETGRFLERQ